jgi:hypothetical protein
LPGREADLFIDFFERDADGEFFGFLQIDANVMLIDELFGDALSGTYIMTASADENQSIHEKIR